MAEIKAIETEYNGYKFRSRLEARWAVFFDYCGIPYEYEPEGFEVDGKKYLPDFFLPEVDRWVEIKGKKLTAEELEKCSAFCEAQDSDGIKFSIFIGQPLDGLVGIMPGEHPGTISFTDDLDHARLIGIKSHAYHWKSGTYKDPSGNTIDVDDSNDMYINPSLCESRTLSRFMPMLWYDMNVPKDMFIEGAFNARQARFEHGETPAVKR